jgi:hypothetical protein
MVIAETSQVYFFAAGTPYLVCLHLVHRNMLNDKEFPQYAARPLPVRAVAARCARGPDARGAVTYFIPTSLVPRGTEKEHKRYGRTG